MLYDSTEFSATVQKIRVGKYVIHAAQGTPNSATMADSVLQRMPFCAGTNRLVRPNDTGVNSHMVNQASHKSHRVGWLRAAVLGANDGIVSTASLIIGVAAASVDHNAILLAGLAGVVAGTMSMAAGEFVSVSSQADTEQADLELERQHLATDIELEQKELSTIYEERGLDPFLAKQVAEQLMAFDALGAHARDELGFSTDGRARPIQAALSSAIAFLSGASLPLLTALFVPMNYLIALVALFSLIFLAALGAIAASVGGAPRLKGSVRVTFWGTVAMAATAAVGHLFGVAV
jgi:vacuolar iron transporter family protein